MSLKDLGEHSQLKHMTFEQRIIWMLVACGWHRESDGVWFGPSHRQAFTIEEAVRQQIESENQAK